MEIINIAGYIEEEKQNSKKKSFDTKTVKASWNEPTELIIPDETILELIDIIPKKQVLGDAEREVRAISSKKF